MILAKVFQRPFKRQVLTLFMPVVVISLLTIGLFSYFYETYNIKKNAVSLIDGTVNQTAALMDDKLMTLFSQMINLSNSEAVNNLMLDNYGAQEDSGGFQNVLECYNSMEQLYRTYDQIIDSLYFINNQGAEVKYFTSDVPRHIGLSLPEWLEAYDDNPQGVYWLNDHENQVFQTTTPHRVISLFRVIGSPTSEASGIMLFNLNSDYFKSILDNVPVMDNGYLMLVSKDGLLRSGNAGNQYTFPNIEIAKLRDNLGKNGTMELHSVNSQSMLVTYRTVAVNGWMVAAAVPQSDLVSSAGQFSTILAVLLAVLISIVALLSNLLAKSVSKPIEYLSDQVIKFDSGDMNVDFNLDAENEIGVLSHGLSYLKQAVIELMDQVRKEQQQKNRMQLLAMQEQIKPHFLYNTIGSIKNLVEMERNQQASDMCVALAKFYRLGISSGREIVPLEEELDHVMNYLTIQRMRYEKDFEYEIDVEQELLAMEVLKLSLQPLVENAIYHGIKTKEGLGTIIISGEMTEDHAEIRVYDDGVGMSGEQLEELRRSMNLPRETDHMKNFGLRNVNLRLRLHFGLGAGLRFDSVKDVYTQATIVIPLKKREEDHRA